MLGKGPGYSSHLSNVEVRSALPARIAIAIQGSAKQLDELQDVLSHMSTQSDVDLFVLLYDKSVNSTSINAWQQWLLEPCTPLRELIYNSSTTWTTGRNMLAQAMYREETRRGKQYKYWVFLDADMWMINCNRCPASIAGAACCWDYFMSGVLLSSSSFATVTGSVPRPMQTILDDLSRNKSLDKTFVFSDCSDAQLQAFHRDAVPVLLPYHPDLDAISWWSSQGILFRFTSGCLAGSNVGLGRHFTDQQPMHTDYPRSRNKTFIEAETNIVTAHFPSISDLLTRPGLCVNQGLGEIREMVTTADLGQSLHWQNTENFQRCLATKKDFFMKEVGMHVPPAPR